MSDALFVAIEGIRNFDDIASLNPKEIQRKAVMALNKTADRARKAAVDEIKEQVNLPAQYITGGGGTPRLGVTKRATGADLRAIVSGRDRPTSLARFAGPGRFGKAGVRVEVEPGKSHFMASAFRFKLRRGSAPISAGFNTGLAIRMTPQLKAKLNKYKFVEIGKGLYLLYGPSIDQLFRTIAPEHTAPIAQEALEREFIRLMEADI